MKILPILFPCLGVRVGNGHKRWKGLVGYEWHTHDAFGERETNLDCLRYKVIYFWIITVTNNYFCRNQSNGLMVGVNYVGRGSNSTTAVWEDDLMVGNPCDPSHLQVRVVDSSSSKSHYCLNVPHVMSNSDSSGPRQ